MRERDPHAEAMKLERDGPTKWQRDKRKKPRGYVRMIERDEL